MTKKFPGQAAVTRLLTLVKAGLAGKQDKLTGTAGQVVGFGSSGTVGAVTIRAGDNVSVTRSGNVITISAAGAGTSSGQIFTVSVGAEPEGAGSVQGGGMFQDGAQCTVTAASDKWYNFAGWRADGSIISSAGSYTFPVTGNVTLTAVFKEKQWDLSRYGTATPLSVARGKLNAAAVGNYALFASGSNDNNSSVADAYNSSLVRTTPAAPSQRMSAYGAVTVGNYALFGGGYVDNKASAVVVAYSSSLTRTTPAALSHARTYPAAAAVGEYALFGGGYGDTYPTEVNVYDGSLTRTTPTAVSAARSGLAAASSGKYAIFGGGLTENYSKSAVVDAFDASLVRTTPAALSQARNGLSATAAGNYVLFGGGYCGSYSAVVDAYSGSLTRSTPAALSAAREYIAAASVGNYALFGGGNTVSDKFAVVDVYMAS